uniref:Uncharacterized protein n=1 Tax=Cyprinus carpio TaxID=7962 RepID=A0A8C1KGC3_CYPCA
MCNVHDNQQGGGRDHDELQRPQSDVRDGEEVVVAYAVAAGLLGVAGEMRFLVAPHTLRRHHKNQDPENEEDRQPNSPNAGGMSVPIFPTISTIIGIGKIKKNHNSLLIFSKDTLN